MGDDDREHILSIQNARAGMADAVKVHDSAIFDEPMRHQDFSWTILDNRQKGFWRTIDL